MREVRWKFLLLLLAAALVAGCREEGDIRISSLDFEGVEQIRKSALADALQTRKGSWLPWGRKTYFDRRAFEADLQRIQAFYRDRGFPDARVTSFDVELNDTQDEVDLTVHINEGAPIVVDGIDLTGFDVLGDGEQRALRDSLPLLAEQPLDRQLVEATHERALNALRDQGYPYAEVAMEEVAAGPRRTRLVLTATPGMLAHFGPVEIVGTRTVQAHVVERQLTYKPGDVFTRQAMRESQRKLYRLELFEFANIESREDREERPPLVPTRVTVAEGKHRRVQFGLGYGSEERARARVRWDHRNLFNGAQQFGVEAKWSSLDRGVRLEYREPFFLASNLSLNFEGQAWQAAEPVYSTNQLGGRVTLRYQRNSQSFLSTSLINEYQRSTIEAEALTAPFFDIRDDLIALGLDPRDGTQRGTLSAIAFDASHNTTDNLLDSRRGYSLTGHVEQAGKWLWGDFNYFSVSGEARHYLPVMRRFVIANRLRLGTVDPSGDADENVPFYKRYFLGGASSVRGWGRFEVSPLSGFGFPIGGHSLLEGSSEVRLPLFGKVGAVVFFDYGNVWSDAWNFDLGDLRYAAGPGLRYLTPVGPARIDFGYQLNPIENLRVNGEPETRHWRIHFSIGQAF
jgi:outer membrane protein insertion porin family/translocation and assembly module TamA